MYYVRVDESFVLGKARERGTNWIAALAENLRIHFGAEQVDVDRRVHNASAQWVVAEHKRRGSMTLRSKARVPQYHRAWQRARVGVRFGSVGTDCFRCLL
jgi:hypothetical protein